MTILYGVLVVIAILVVLAIGLMYFDYKRWSKSLKPVEPDFHDDWIICPSCGINRIPEHRTECGQCNQDMNSGGSYGRYN